MRNLSRAVRLTIVAAAFVTLWAAATVYFATSQGRDSIVVADLFSGFVWPAILSVFLNRWLSSRSTSVGGAR